MKDLGTYQFEVLNRQPFQRERMNIAHKKKKSKEMKLPKGSASISIGWLGTEVVTLFNGKQLKKFAKIMGIPKDDEFVTNLGRVGGMASVAYFANGVPCFILFLPSSKRRVIIHECTHMVHMLCDNHGIPISEANTETIAYMTDHLCEIVFGIFEQKAGNA